MNNVIGNIIQDKQAIKNQLGGTPNVYKVPFRFEEAVKPLHVVTKINAESVTGAMIWGSSIFGVWGSASWGDTSGSSFIIGSPSFGILGTNKLGAGGSQTVLYAVLPQDNIFTEYFGQNDYIDTVNSNGTLDTAAETYTINSTEVLQSGIICKLRTPIYNATFLNNQQIIDTGVGMYLPFTLGSDVFSGDNVEIYFSNDSGSTWVAANEGEKLTFINSSTGDELKYKIIGFSGTTVISTPLYIQINQ